MSLTNCECVNPQEHGCLFCFIQGCEDDIFKEIGYKHEELVVFDEDTYYEELSECRHNMVDNCVADCSNDDVEQYVESYGTLKALKLYESRFGGLKELLSGYEFQINKALLYCILDEHIKVEYRIYNNYNALHRILA
jgi:hypothetical protein